MSKVVILIAPGLLAAPPPQLAMLHSLAVLGRYAGAPRVALRGCAAALLDALGMPDTTPVAPLALLGAGGDPADDYVLCADPVQLAADRSTVVLANAIDDLSKRDADTLVRMLDRHFASDELRFETPQPDAWFARQSRVPDLVTTPPDAARGLRLFDSLPRGSDAGPWRRWQNEIEMLLHEHPVNAAREARGLAPVTAVWFWGGGRIDDVAQLPTIVVAAPSGRPGNLARGLAIHGHGAHHALQPGANFAALLSQLGPLDTTHGVDASIALIVLPPIGDDTRALESNWLSPAIRALDRRRIDALHLIADGRDTVATWTARSPGAWQRIRARASRQSFVMPEIFQGLLQ